MTDVIKETCDVNNGLNPAKLWELVKFQIVQKATKYASIKAKHKKERLLELNKELNKLVEDQCTTLVENSRQQGIIKAEIEDICEQIQKLQCFVLKPVGRVKLKKAQNIFLDWRSKDIIIKRCV